MLYIGMILNPIAKNEISCFVILPFTQNGFSHSINIFGAFVLSLLDINVFHNFVPSSLDIQLLQFFSQFFFFL